MKPFSWIQEHAFAHAGETLVRSRLPQVKTPEQLAAVPDDRYLSDMSRRVFRAGLKHSVVDGKWPAFEQAFFNFEPAKLCLISDEQLESQMQNGSIIRHWGKIKSIRTNAVMVNELSQQHGGFGRFLAQWPSDEIIDLWKLFKKQGSQLGGMSGSSFLRMVGKDTFKLTPDVVAALKAQDIIDKNPTSQRDLKKVQQVFNQWHQQSGQPYSHISLMLSYTVGW
ncbi:MAG: DNA-3-methyladenine glycosylase I [Motiliproteus sp.]|nr:DNA-3-methyladenine glycosylase I [Motiliproteus sp.]MCW9053013.1 DNA-3-methyladenine glycosylase I [Motiliproteus sp.]